MTFDDFDLDHGVMDGIDAMGYKTPSPIQQQAIPIILRDRDLIGCAQTGTGKTAAFMLPILDKILSLDTGYISTLILVPTRELAIQIDQQVEAMSYYIDVSSIAVYGGGSGHNWAQQKTALKTGADIVIATPGRLMAQMQMGGLDFSRLQHLVLDEADRMLDMGFFDDIMQIVSALPKERQTLLFSATMPPKMRQLASSILRNPEEVTIALAKPAEGVRLGAFLVNDDQKNRLLLHILKTEQPKSLIIFSGSKDKVKSLERELRRQRLNLAAFHSDLEQQEREALMQGFRSGRIPILVGTDVLARGIDVEGIEMVINYDVPRDADDYVHRVGRTARAERTGTAYTFINADDMRSFGQIEKLIQRDVEKIPLPEGFAPGPEYNPAARGAGSPRGRGGSGRPGGGGGRGNGGQGGQRSSSGGGGSRSGGSGGSKKSGYRGGGGNKGRGGKPGGGSGSSGA